MEGGPLRLGAAWPSSFFGLVRATRWYRLGDEICFISKSQFILYQGQKRNLSCSQGHLEALRRKLESARERFKRQGEEGRKRQGEEGRERKRQGVEGVGIQVVTQRNSFLDEVGKLLDDCGEKGDRPKICADIFKLATNSREVYLGLCSLGTHGASDVGSFSKELEKIPISSTSGFEPVSESRLDLLPIPLSLAKTFFHMLRSQPGCIPSPAQAEEVAMSAL